MIPTVKRVLEMYRAGECTLEQALAWIDENAKLDHPEARPIKRYDLYASSGGQDCWLSTEESPTGEWVRYEDIASLLPQLGQSQEGK